jgi:hypothetical protein
VGQTVDATESHSLRRFAPQHVELVSKNQDFRLKPCSQPEQPGQRRVPPMTFCGSRSGVSRASSLEKRGEAPQSSNPSRNPQTFSTQDSGLSPGADEPRLQSCENGNESAERGAWRRKTVNVLHNGGGAAK